MKSILDQIEHVEFSKVLNTGEEGIYQVEISSLIEFDIREDVFFRFADAKCPILEMTNQVPTLEEVFLRLTGEGTKQYGGRLSKEEKKKARAARTASKKAARESSVEEAAEQTSEVKEEEQDVSNL